MRENTYLSGKGLNWSLLCLFDVHVYTSVLMFSGPLLHLCSNAVVILNIISIIIIISSSSIGGGGGAAAASWSSLSFSSPSSSSFAYDTSRVWDICGSISWNTIMFCEQQYLAYVRVFLCPPKSGMKFLNCPSSRPIVCLSVRQSVRPSEHFIIGHNFWNLEDRILIFGMHVYLMELHILCGQRSRSSFKVKDQIYGFKAAQKGALCFWQTPLLLVVRLRTIKVKS